MSSDGARCLKVDGTRKTGLTGGLSRAPCARVWRRIRGPSFIQKKMNEFGIGRDAISRRLEGLTSTLQSLLSRYSITFSIPHTSPHPTLTISVQIWTNYETHIFLNLGRYAIDRVLTPKMLSGSLADAKVTLCQTKRQCSAPPTITSFLHCDEESIPFSGTF